ncbi:MAG: SHOCT domain-containing protein [Candidatus Scalindua rubra]|uniref:SHOCT domain-containing protein n=1 Tax=Candidatus Scalindua brodae TaxID=237368 RepID=A0A0B0EIK9_9BACT|nr:MAG: hypothetical protein SCABRO_02402 [Candidatus Scalindua brodae]MBZ0108962.1 SHOCT domain-containing protein [Candidatus Scalindua rubra]TWU36390.1 hypothetical protein S225a_06690 [Candidatus Brocadiaceae bacterium S225]
MKQYYLLKFISLLLLLSLVTGCFSYNKKIPRKSNIVGATVNDNNTSVEIREELDENGNVIKKNYNHPYYFTAGGLTNILSSIFYTQKSLLLGARGKKQLYQKAELQIIVPPILSAFSMANDTQDILVFSTVDKILLSDAQSYFSMFISNSELNIVFSDIQNKKSINDGRSFRKSNKAKFKDPFEVKRSGRWNLIPMEGQRFAPGHQNWLIFDLSSNLFGVAGSDNSSNNVEDNPLKASSRARTIERKVRTSDNFVEEKQKYQDVRDKLKELKVLSDEGLISDEDYELKKKELLNEF